jgi:rare lipoprotein A
MTFFLNWTTSPYLYNQDRRLNKVFSISHDSEKIDPGEKNNPDNQSFHAVLKKQILASQENQTLHDTSALPSSSLGAGISDGASPSASQLSSSPDHYLEYTVQPGDTLWSLAVKKYHVNVKDLINDNKIQDPRKLQAGQKIKIRLPAYTDGTQKVVGSWYGKAYHGRPMANGEPYNMYAETIAHRDLPLGTMVELSNPETGQKVIAKVTDRGPFIEGRDVDLSFNLAQRLSLVGKGVGTLLMKVLG